jgi:hypothetical protein
MFGRSPRTKRVNGSAGKSRESSAISSLTLLPTCKVRRDSCSGRALENNPSLEYPAKMLRHARCKLEAFCVLK